MSDPNSNNHSTSTNTQIIQTDDNWSNTVRSIFIYGVGALRFIASKTPPGRAFTVTSTVAGDFVTRVMTNVINDPNYISSIRRNWSLSYNNDNTEATVRLDQNSEEMINQKAEEVIKAESASSNNDSTSNLTGIDLDTYAENSLNLIISYLNPILAPINVTYSNELLASQIQGVSVMLFIITVITMFLFIVFAFNAIILIYRDRIVGYFKNKYIRAYLNLQAKIIAIELIFLSGTIVYFLYNIAIGAQFIARHPINFT